MECNCKLSILYIFHDKSLDRGGGSGVLRGDKVERWTYIVLSQETRAKLQVIIQVEGPTGLKSSTKSGNGRSFGKLPHAFHSSELTLGVLRSHLRTTAGATAVMVIRRIHMGGSISLGEMLLVLVRMAVEES